VAETQQTQTAQVYRVIIKAKAEQVWEAITKPEFTAGYYFGTRVETTLEPGSAIVYHSRSGDGIDIEGEIVESDPPRRLVHTFRSLWGDDLAVEPPSRVTWEIEPADGGVSQLTVTHDQLERSPKTAEQVSGWLYIISGLKTLLETGKPMAA
jgi:uncharacterized protein YndB with AHSA1/START domain